jgi:hypothetical protein
LPDNCNSRATGPSAWNSRFHKVLMTIVERNGEKTMDW